MNGLWIILAVAALLAFVMIWAFRALPREEWQFIASVPRSKDSSGAWSGLNLTFYGFFTANAYLLSAATFLVLVGSMGGSLLSALSLLAPMLGLCVPASRWIALHVDRTKSGFTVAGAAFVGLVASPAVVYLLNAISDQIGGQRLSYSAALAAIAISYCLGEGVGRFACISFGCCYGKPLAQVGPRAARVFRRLHFVFRGSSKKISYASGLEGVKVVPVQALTAVVCSLTGIFGIAFFLHGRYITAFLLTVAVSQIWRAYSETLRADYRGEGEITAYQAMALAAVPIAGCIAAAIPVEDAAAPNIAMGFAVVWNPLTLLLLQAVWVALFLFTGRSETTGSVVSFHVALGVANTSHNTVSAAQESRHVVVLHSNPRP